VHRVTAVDRDHYQVRIVLLLGRGQPVDPRPAATSGPGIPDGLRHREKRRLALDMIEEMTGPGGRAVLDLVTAAGAPARW
jgi:hypothetical protein